MAYVPVANNQQDYHTYGMNWTSAAVTWTVDGAPVRTLKYADAKGGSRFPQTPSRLKIGVWAAPTSSPGVVEWAGGLVDLSKGPFAMTVSNVNIVNYSPAKQYRYKDKTGNWDSIEIIGGGSAGGIVEPDQEPTPSATGKPIQVSTASTMVPMMPSPTNLETGTGGSLPPSPAFTGATEPGNSSAVATASASANKASNGTASVSKPTASPSASKPASASGATARFGATSAAIAGFSLLFLVFLA